jgi:sulfate permease, SulP family
MSQDQANAPPKRSRLRPGDWRAGVAVATVTLVTSVSYAAMAGAPLGAALSASAVLSGLIGATLGGAVAALSGLACRQFFSPRASVAVIIASALATRDLVSHGAQSLLWLTACLLLAGVMQAGFGALRLGGLIRLIPHSVTAGLTIGIAASMAWSQLPHWWPAADVRGWAQLAPLALGLLTMAVVFWAQRRGWSGWALPAGVLIGALSNTVLTAAWPLVQMPPLPHLQAVDWSAAPLLSVAALMQAFVHAPSASAALQNLPSLAGFALAIALVNSVETLAATVVLEDATKRRFDVNRVLLASSLASLAAVCAGGLPVASSAATSTVSLKAGGRSRRLPLIAAGMLGVLALVCCAWLWVVPLAVVAGLMLTVALALVQAPLRELWAMRLSRRTQTPRTADALVLILVGALALTTDIVSAVLGGVAAAAVLLVMQMQRTLIRRQYDANHPDAQAHLHAALTPEAAERIHVIELAQPLFFATAEAVVQVIEARSRRATCTILDLSYVGAIDTTAARVLARCARAQRRGQGELLLVPGVSAMSFGPGGDRDGACSPFASLGEALRFAAQLQSGAAPSAEVIAFPRDPAAAAARRASLQDADVLPSPALRRSSSVPAGLSRSRQA